MPQRLSREIKTASVRCSKDAVHECGPHKSGVAPGAGAREGSASSLPAGAVSAVLIWAHRGPAAPGQSEPLIEHHPRHQRGVREVNAWAIPLPFPLSGKRRWRTLRRLLCPMTAPPGTWRARPNPACELPCVAVAPCPAQRGPRHASAPVRGGAGRSAAPAAAARDRTGARGAPALPRRERRGHRRRHRAGSAADGRVVTPQVGSRAGLAR
jgi:hypothetical protein